MAYIDDLEARGDAQGLDVLVEQEPGVVEAVLGRGAAAQEQGELALGVGQQGDVVADAAARAEGADGVGQRHGQVELQQVRELGDVAEGRGQGVLGGAGEGGVVVGVGQGEAADAEGERGAGRVRRDGEDARQVLADAPPLPVDALARRRLRGPRLRHLGVRVLHVFRGPRLRGPAFLDGGPPRGDAGLQVGAPGLRSSQGACLRADVVAGEVCRFLGLRDDRGGRAFEEGVYLRGEGFSRGEGVLDGVVQVGEFH